MSLPPHFWIFILFYVSFTSCSISWMSFRSFWNRMLQFTSIFWIYLFGMILFSVAIIVFSLFSLFFPMLTWYGILLCVSFQCETGFLQFLERCLIQIAFLNSQISLFCYFLYSVKNMVACFQRFLTLFLWPFFPHFCHPWCAQIWSHSQQFLFSVGLCLRDLRNQSEEIIVATMFKWANLLPVLAAFPTLALWDFLWVTIDPHPISSPCFHCTGESMLFMSLLVVCFHLLTS